VEKIQVFLTNYFYSDHLEVDSRHLLTKESFFKDTTKIKESTAIFVTSDWIYENQTNLKILEATEDSTETEHIPMAFQINTNDIEKPPLWNLINSEELQIYLESKGISWNSEIVIYGKNCLAVSRVAWTLFYAGVENIKILNGGIVGWKMKFKTVKYLESPKKTLFGKIVPAHPEYNKSIYEMQKIISKNLEFSIVCVRSEEEFKGEISGYSYIQFKGRIPNSIWGGNAKNWFHEESNQFMNPLEIEQHWKNQQLKSQNLIFYCGTGWRSSLAFIYAKSLGYQNISNFDGSWNE
jgi:molybdopterin synthase sulfurtransferase